MIHKINEVKFQGNNFNRTTFSGQQQLSKPNLLLRQPIRDEVSFTGPAKLRDLMKALKKAGFYEVTGTGKHGTKVQGLLNGKPVKIPIPVHGGSEVAEGTANAIAREAGFRNLRELLSK